MIRQPTLFVYSLLIFIITLPACGLTSRFTEVRKPTGTPARRLVILPAVPRQSTDTAQLALSIEVSELPANLPEQVILPTVTPEPIPDAAIASDLVDDTTSTALAAPTPVSPASENVIIETNSQPTPTLTYTPSPALDFSYIDNLTPTSNNSDAATPPIKMTTRQPTLTATSRTGLVASLLNTINQSTPTRTPLPTLTPTPTNTHTPTPTATLVGCTVYNVSPHSMIIQMYCKYTVSLRYIMFPLGLATVSEYCVHNISVD